MDVSPHLAQFKVNVARKIFAHVDLWIYVLVCIRRRVGDSTAMRSPCGTGKYCGPRRTVRRRSQYFSGREVWQSLSKRSTYGMRVFMDLRRLRRSLPEPFVWVLM